MGDQAKWFKLWVSAPHDDGLQQLPPEHRWAWAVLGCYTKQHGTNGSVEITPSNTALAAAMCIKPEALREVIGRLPHVVISGAQTCDQHVDTDMQNRHGAFTVTWRNWLKYQEDSTAAERQASRRKKRREEMRRDTPPKSSSSSSTPDPAGGAEPRPRGRAAARVRTRPPADPEPAAAALAEFMRVVREKAEAPAFLPPRRVEPET